ncbi:hypothetical protein PVMG_02544 [Plasmodium vivax Mauritania I]|uniref:VIR protein n=1 Tax=Plasmodium vivax Mauritania I TaxID=1035515 RepID=A0A0J9TGH9_PLAVI|nr:hypothetical protein PVMG_02544 [Plasmodium vivax Mauritania I]
MGKIKVPQKFLEPTNVFKRVHRLLGNSYPFMKYFNDNYCKYVNFCLNKIIHPLYSEEDKEEYFSFFKKFGTELETIKRTTSTCLSYLHSIKPEVFTKMDLLYDLYDKYSAHVEFKKPQDGPKCNDLRLFRLYYNDIISRYDGKEKKIIEKLIELKELVGKNIFSPDKKFCGEEVSYYNEPEKYLEQKKQLELAQKMQEQQQQLQQQQQQEHQEQIKESSGYKHIQQEEEIESREQLLSVEPEEVQRISLGTEQSHVDLNTVVPELPKYLRIPKVETTPYKQEMEENEVEKHGTVYPTSEKNQDIGYFGKMQGVITGVLGEVEPGPILGVSGGMGALFLLFKVYKVLKIYSYVYNTFKYNLSLP